MIAPLFTIGRNVNIAWTIHIIWILIILKYICLEEKNYCKFSISSYSASCLIKNVNFFCCLFGKLNGLQSENVKSDHHFLPDFKICIWLKWMNTPVTIMCSFKIFSPQQCDFDINVYNILFQKILAMSCHHPIKMNLIFILSCKIHNIKYLYWSTMN